MAEDDLVVEEAVAEHFDILTSPAISTTVQTVHHKLRQGFV